MATPDQIPSDLTLEIGENLSPDLFLSAARAFFGYIDEVGKGLGPDRAPEWTVRVREGSNLIVVDPIAIPPEVANAVYAQVQRGVSRLADGDIEESGLTEPALRHLRTLSDLNQAPKRRAALRIWVERKPILLTPEIGETIREDMRIDYRDFGTVEGRLEAIQDQTAGLQLRIRDSALRLVVKCSVEEDLLPKAFQLFRKRVEAVGLVHYRRNGTPVSIDASEIEPLPDDSELPGPDEVRGILRVSA